LIVAEALKSLSLSFDVRLKRLRYVFRLALVYVSNQMV